MSTNTGILSQLLANQDEIQFELANLIQPYRRSARNPGEATLAGELLYPGVCRSRHAAPAMTRLRALVMGTSFLCGIGLAAHDSVALETISQSFHGTIFKACTGDGRGEDILLDARVNTSSNVIEDVPIAVQVDPAIKQIPRKVVKIVMGGEVRGTARGLRTGKTYSIQKKLSQTIEMGSGPLALATAKELSRTEIPNKIVPALFNAVVFSDCSPQLEELSCEDFFEMQLWTCDDLFASPGDIEKKQMCYIDASLDNDKCEHPEKYRKN